MHSEDMKEALSKRAIRLCRIVRAQIILSCSYNSYVQATRPTSTMRHPLASASPLPDGLVMRQDTFSVLNYDPGDTYWPLIGHLISILATH